MNTETTQNLHSSRAMENNWPLPTDQLGTNTLLCTINIL